MTDSEQNYKMADIRKCISTLGDTTQSKWLDKRLVPCSKQKKGIRTNIRYSALEIVHVCVLAQTSTWGVLNYYNEVNVSGGYISPSTFLFMEPDELAGLPLCPHMGRSELSLTEPEKIVDYYREHGPNLKIIVTSRQVPIEQEDKRMRRTKTVFDMRILTPTEAMEWENDQEGISPDIELMTLATYDIPNKDVPEAYMEFGFLKLNLKQIITHVYKKLDLLYLLD